MKIAFAGSILVDSVKTISEWPAKGMLVPITSIRRAVGGSVCNSGIDLKTLDPSVQVSAIGRVGTDDNGDFAVETLSEHGIDVSRVMRDKTRSTSFTDVMTVESTGERTFFNFHGADSLFEPDDVNIGDLNCDIFHFGYLLLLDGMDASDAEYGTKAARLLAKVQAAGIKTSIDIVSEQSDRFARVVRPALKYCDYLVVNEIEGSMATRISHCDASGKTSREALAAIAEKLFELGVREKVVLHCPEMSLCRDAAGDTAFSTTFALPNGWIKGSVGAGDAFCAGMLYSFLKGMDAEEAMTLANASAAANLAATDSISGALPLRETMELAKRFSRR